MNFFRLRFLPVLFLTLLASSAANAGTVHGTVTNRTTGQPAPNVDVALLNPQTGMSQIASTKTDAQGQFTFDNPAVGAGMVLIQATYQGVHFNSPLPPGRPEATVDVFDLSKDPKTINVVSHVVIFEPRENNKLLGAEEYNVENSSTPPHAFFRTDGNFEFAIPAEATLQQVATTSSTGMPVTQASIEKGKGRYAIAYAFRPGATSVRLSYEVPYPSSATTVKLPASYAGMKLLVVAPPGVTITGEGLQPAGQEQGMMVYLHPPLAANETLSVSVSGAGTPQPAEAENQQGQDQTQEGNSRAQGPDVQAVPARLDDLKWPLLIGIASLFVLGAFLLSRKKVVVASPSDEEETEPIPAPKPKQSSSSGAIPNASVPATVPGPNATVAAVQNQVNASLDSLKDEMFRLELRHQAGTISEDDYTRERTRIEKVLRDLVRG
jgi:Carboxypeptidase regulatory-like domain